MILCLKTPFWRSISIWIPQATWQHEKNRGPEDGNSATPVLEHMSINEPSRFIYLFICLQSGQPKSPGWLRVKLWISRGGIRTWMSRGFRWHNFTQRLLSGEARFVRNLPKVLLKQTICCQDGWGILEEKSAPNIIIIIIIIIIVITVLIASKVNWWFGFQMVWNLGIYRLEKVPQKNPANHPTNKGPAWRSNQPTMKLSMGYLVFGKSGFGQWIWSIWLPWHHLLKKRFQFGKSKKDSSKWGVSHTWFVWTELIWVILSGWVVFFFHPAWMGGKLPNLKPFWEICNLHFCFFFRRGGGMIIWWDKKTNPAREANSQLEEVPSEVQEDWAEDRFVLWVGDVEDGWQAALFWHDLYDILKLLK